MFRYISVRAKSLLRYLGVMTNGFVDNVDIITRLTHHLTGHPFHFLSDDLVEPPFRQVESGFFLLQLPVDILPIYPRVSARCQKPEHLAHSPLGLRQLL